MDVDLHVTATWPGHPREFQRVWRDRSSFRGGSPLNRDTRVLRPSPPWPTWVGRCRDASLGAGRPDRAALRFAEEPLEHEGNAEPAARHGRVDEERGAKGVRKVNHGRISDWKPQDCFMAQSSSARLHFIYR